MRRAIRTVSSWALIASSGSFAVWGCASTVPREEATPVQSEMFGHFREAQELQAGAIFGDLQRMRAAGARLTSSLGETILPPRAESQVADLRVAAANAADANDVGAGRRAAADVARSCGSCHRQFQVGPGIVVGSAPQGTSLRQHMARQERISRLLWAGLVGASDDDWDEGARELRNEPPFPQEIVARIQDPVALRTARSELQSLGGDAAAATTSDERAQVLSRVWGVCSGCHQVAGTSGF